MIFHELESEWALEIVRGVERVAGQHHLAVVLSEMQGRRSPGRGWIEGVLARRPTGVIAVFSDLSDSIRGQLATRGIPYVVVDPTGEPLHDTPSIGATNWNGGLTATRHLLSLGHRRIGVIGGPEWILCSRARLDGYRAAMDEAGVPIDPELISHGQFHVEEGIDRGRALLRLKDRPTAIFAGNDLQALGVYQAAREARLHIPEDLSVVGFDDLPVAQWVGPPMTTVRQPLMDMATAAAEMVVAMARGETPAQTAGRAGDRARHPREHRAAGVLTPQAIAEANRRTRRFVRRRVSRTRPAPPRGPRTDRPPRSTPRSPCARTAGRRPSPTRRSRRPGRPSDERWMSRSRVASGSERPVDRLADRGEELVGAVGDAAADDDERRVVEVHHARQHRPDPAAGSLQERDRHRVAERCRPGDVLGGDRAVLVEGGPEPGAPPLERGRGAGPPDGRTAGKRLEAADVAAPADDRRIVDDLDVPDVAGTALGAAVEPAVGDDPGADARSRS